MNQSDFSQGFLGGYQTMDALGALVFGGIMLNTFKEKGYTIEGAKTYIKEAKKKPMNSFEIIEKLNEIKSRLLKIKKEL